MNTIRSDDSSQLALRVSPRPSLRFSCPTAHEAGRSDLCRVYLARLCCVFRLSRPLDAFLRFRPSGLVSYRWRPWASGLQRVSLRRSECRLPATLALHAVDRPVRDRHPSATRICASTKSVALGRGLARGPQPDPLLTFSLRGFPLVGLGLAPSTAPSKLGVATSARPPFMGFDTVPDGRNRPSPYLLCNVSKIRRVEASLSRCLSLPGILGPS